MDYHKVVRSVLFASLFLLPGPARAHYHLGWIVNEAYTNASGTNQFVELFNNCCNGQHVLNSNVNSGPASLFSDSTSNKFVFPADLSSSSTSGKFVLLGTTGFANLAGAPALDFTLPGNFFDIAGDTIRFGDGFGGDAPFFGEVDSLSFASIPTNGIDSISADGITVTTNSPTNFAGETGTVIPEPSSFVLAFLALVGLGKRRK